MPPPIIFQSTHSLRSATQYSQNDYLGGDISIHALLAECDFLATLSRAYLIFQSTHSLRSATIFVEGGIALGKEFQSTHSLRSATFDSELSHILSGISIHALLAECDESLEQSLPNTNISIHALLAECDHHCEGRDDLLRLISIHALLAECDYQHQRIKTW